MAQWVAVFTVQAQRTEFKSLTHKKGDVTKCACNSSVVGKGNIILVHIEEYHISG